MVIRRPYDRNDARRALRKGLLQSVEAARREDVPHSFDTVDLLDFTNRELNKGLRGRRAQQLALTQTAGRAFLLNGEEKRGQAIFETALDMARTDQQRAETHFLIGLLVHQRVGDYRRARDSFQETINYIPAASMTRAQATLGLIRCYAQLGDLEGAEAAYQAALGLGIGEVEPEAQLKFASALWEVGKEYKEAIRENREAHAGFSELGDREGQHACDSNLVGAYLAMEDYKRAYQLGQQVRDAQESILDLSRLGTTYANLALALRHLGRLDEAIDASRQSIHYHHENRQPANKTRSILSLGRTMLLKGDTDRGLAMLQIAADRASQPDAIDRRTDMVSTLLVLDTLVSKKRYLEAAPSLIARYHDRLNESMESGFGNLSKHHLANFALTTADLARAGVKMPRRGATSRLGSFPNREAYFDARRMVKEAETHELDSRLDRRLSTGPRLHKAPALPLLKKFLLSFAGTSFQNGNYQEEFFIPQEKAKHHLRELRDAAIIRQEGSKRGSRYLLSFHLG